MSILKQALGGITGGKVLDVASGEGGFIRTLVENLKSYVDVIGIDTIEYTKGAGSIFNAQDVRFIARGDLRGRAGWSRIQEQAGGQDKGSWIRVLCPCLRP